MRKRTLACAAVAAVLWLAGIQSAGARVSGFESGGFGEFSWHSAANGSLTVTAEQAYEGAWAARASNDGLGLQFQRVWYDVDLQDGADVWYGVALLIPRLADWCRWSPVQWDNWRSYGPAGDVGGVRIARGAAFVDRGTYTGRQALLGPVPVPEGRWFWLEVHQRFSARDGEGLTELFLDGRRVGTSTAANGGGRRIDAIRYGNVGLEASCSVPSSILFDRPSLTSHGLGPRLGAPALANGSTPANDGAFELSWPDPGETRAYVLQHRDGRPGAGYADVAEAGTGFAFTPSARESEGTWTYRLRAADAPGTEGVESEPSAPVKVDRTPPSPPSVTTSRPPDHESWFKDSVTVRFAANGDPALADGSSPSGVDPATVPSPVTVDRSGERVVTGSVADRAGNVSEAASRTVRIDGAPPEVRIDGCPGAVATGADVRVSVTASDDGSGLASDPSGTAVLDTADGGRHTYTATAVDNVGHRGAAVCDYLVGEPIAASRVGGFETGDFSEFSWWSVAGGSLFVSDEDAYEGSWAAKAANSGVGNEFQRVWYDVALEEGTEVWYGLALRIPRVQDWCWWMPVRWDNWRSHGSEGDVGGIRIERDEMYVGAGTYAAQQNLIGPVPVPEGRWFWVEVHQRLSGRDGEALTELFVDGAPAGSSTAANSGGRTIDTIRYGNVAMAQECSAPSSIMFDRVSLTDHELGPLTP